MKKIEALIRKAQYEDVKEKLHDVGVTFFSYWDVTGIGNEKIGRVYRGALLLPPSLDLSQVLRFGFC